MHRGNRRRERRKEEAIGIEERRRGGEDDGVGGSTEERPDLKIACRVPKWLVYVSLIYGEPPQCDTLIVIFEIN